MYVIVVQISWATALAAAVLCSTQHTSAQYGLPAQVQPLQRQPTKANSITTLDASMGVMASADAAVSGDKGVSHNVAVSQDNSNQQTIQYSRGSAPPLRQQQRQTQRHGPPGSSRSSRYMQMPLDVRLDYDVDDEDGMGSLATGHMCWFCYTMYQLSTPPSISADGNLQYCLVQHSLCTECCSPTCLVWSTRQLALWLHTRL